MILEPPSWTTDAKCRGVNTDLFFVSPSAVRQIEKIKQKYCRQCPVREECLEYGIKTDSDGIFGGMTRDERVLASLLNSGKIHFTQLAVVASSHLVMRTYSSQDNTQHEQAHQDDVHSLLLSRISYLNKQSQSASNLVAENGWEFLREWTHSESPRSLEQVQDETNQMNLYGRYSA